jgi:hypothetical protein
MNSVNNQMSSEKEENLKKIINEKNVDFDYKNYYLSRMMKFLINFISTYCFLDFLLANNDNLSKVQFILLICTFSSVLFYILDSNFPIISVSI